jgi:tRNA A37 methylthiotransferase MiaB
MDFLERARLDAIGVFAYSDEDGTEAVRLDEHVPEDVIADRCARVTTLAEELMWQRAEERIGEMSSVIVEAVLDGRVEGRAAHQGPEDALTVWDLDEVDQASAEVGDVIEVEFVGVEGVDLIGRPR